MAALIMRSSLRVCSRLRLSLHGTSEWYCSIASSCSSSCSHSRFLWARRAIVGWYCLVLCLDLRCCRSFQPCSSFQRSLPCFFLEVTIGLFLNSPVPGDSFC